MIKHIVYAVISISLLLVSCHQRLFVNEKYVIRRSAGFVVFIDNESRKYRNIGRGDVFTDSLIDDFFIPYKFPQGIVTKKSVEAVLNTDQTKASFIFLRSDCNNEERTSLIRTECLPVILDNDIDDYLHSNRIYLLPVEIEYTPSAINTEYFGLHKDLIISIHGNQTKLVFKPGRLDVLRINVLEFDWSDDAK